MTTVRGYISRIIFQNKENGYTVLTLEASGEEQSEITLVGTMPQVAVGEPLEAEGELREHPIYGEQLAVTSYSQTAPQDILSIERYLGSGAVKGIGPALAARIVGEFGADTLRVIEEEPELLAKIRGISVNGARQIGAQFEQKRELRQALIFLGEYGISMALAVKIYDRYGQELYSIIRKNPYRMADEITGIGFYKADEIARRAGIAVDSDFRIRSGLMFSLSSAAREGHVCLPKEMLLDLACSMLQVDIDEVTLQLENLMIDRKVIFREWSDTVLVYAAPFFYMEMNTARMLLELNTGRRGDSNEAERHIRQIEAEEKLVLDERQREAILAAACGGITVITGGPGTGKTTAINTLIRYFDEINMKIELAAPTGRAAKRMAEATGREARTIHRMLEFFGAPSDDEEEDQIRFARDEGNPLEADAVVIDEMSMVDIHLFCSLLKALKPGTSLVLVGDANQLPSVGPGNVLKDVISSGCFNVVRLTHIFRQDDASDIVVNAHRIHNGEAIDSSARSKDFLFIKRDDVRHIQGAVVGLVRDRLPGYVHAGVTDIQVLTPMRKGALGVENLNIVLQGFLNPAGDKKKERQFPQGIFRVGDKVMQTRNNYEIEWERIGRHGIVTDRGSGVFNGDMGIVRDINFFSEEMTVEFDDGRLITYPYKNVDQLELAYAITVHKSQGSEYPAVVIPLLSGPKMLMNRNLIYTAVTRAKSCVCIVGLPEVFQSMVDNDTEQKRYSGLAECIKETAGWDMKQPPMQEAATPNILT